MYLEQTTKHIRTRIFARPPLEMLCSFRERVPLVHPGWTLRKPCRRLSEKSLRAKRNGAESEAPARLLPYFAARRTSVGALRDGAWRNARFAAALLKRSRLGLLRVGR